MPAPVDDSWAVPLHVRNAAVTEALRLPQHISCVRQVQNPLSMQFFYPILSQSIMFNWIPDPVRFILFRLSARFLWRGTAQMLSKLLGLRGTKTFKRKAHDH